MSDWRKRHDRFMAALDRGDMEAAERIQDEGIMDSLADGARRDREYAKCLALQPDSAMKSLILDTMDELADELEQLEAGGQ